MNLSNAQPMDERRFIRRCVIVALIVIATVILLGFIWTAAHALMLVFAALLIAVGLDGLAQLIHRKSGLSRHAAVVLTATLLAVLLGGALTIGSMNVASQAPKLQSQVVQSIDQISQRLQHYPLTQKLWSSGGGQQQAENPSTLGERLTGEISGVASVTLTTLTDLFVIVIIGLYLALQPTLYRGGLLHLFPPSQRERARDIAAETAIALRRWLIGRVTSMLMVAVFSTLGLWLFGIPFALLLGVMAGLLTFIPYLGALVSAVPALLVAALHGVDTVVYVGALYLGLHIVEGYVLAPLIQKRAVSIAPGFLLSAQVLGGAVAGIFGVALATPIALTIAVIVQLGYVRDVIGGEPHLPGHQASASSSHD